MKSLFFFLPLFCLALVSCAEKSSTADTLVGDWQLVEVLMDPGDGSGVFTPVDSEKTISIQANGAYTASGIICELSTTTTATTSGNFRFETQLVEPSDCRTMQPAATLIPYEFNGKELILQYVCIEPCLHKYRRIE